jgi:type VI protein secretion system component Hcp
MRRAHLAVDNEDARHNRAAVSRPNLRPAQLAPTLAGGPADPRSLMAMQSAAGNRATAALVASRQREAPAKAKRPPPSVVALITLGSGKVVGDSEVADHEGEIDLVALNFSGGRGRAEAGHDLVLTKNHDRSTSPLVRAAANGDPVASAVFSFLRTDEIGDVVVYHKLEFSNGHVSSINIGGDLETVGLAFEEPDRR